MIPTDTARSSWSSSILFVVVVAAAVASLSNLWRLPYLLSEYGGGAFLLIYIGALLTMGLPLFSGQLLMARGTRSDLPGVIAGWTRDAPHSRVWVWSGYLAVFGAALLLAAYSVIAGWSLAYSVRGVTGALAVDSIADSSARFVTFAVDSERGFGWLLLFMCLITATAARGLRRGVQPVMRTLALCMLLAFLALLASAVLDVRAAAALHRLFAVDFAEMNWRGLFEALHQAFFTLSLGTGVVVAFGSYLPPDARIIRLSLAVIAIDLAAALAAAFMLAVFVGGRDVALSAGLQSLFEVLPVALAGGWQTPIMFVLVALVSVSTAVALFEPVVQLVEHRTGSTRLRASVYSGVAVGCLGLLALLSFGALSSLRLLGFDLFGWIMLAATRLIGPLTGLLLCVLLGRVLARRRLLAAWNGHERDGRAVGFALWHMLLRYPTRIALVVVLAYALGALTLIEWIW